MKYNFSKAIPTELLSPSPEFSWAMQSMELHWWYWNAIDKILTISPQLMHLLGYTPQELDPSTPLPDKNIHPEDAMENMLEFNKLINGEIGFYEMEYRVKIEGEWRWYYSRGTVVSTNDSGITELVGGLTIDMSSRFGRMLSRVEQGSKFEFIFKNTNEPVFIIDYSDKQNAAVLVDMNEAGERLLVMKSSEIIGQDITDIIDVIMKDNKSDLLEEISRNGRVSFESVYNDRFGKEKYLDINAHTFTLTGKNLLIAIVNDKTESQLVKRDLKSSEMMFKSIFDNSTSGILILDTDGKIEHNNPIASEFIGISAKKMSKKHISTVLQLNYKELDGHLNTIAKGEEQMLGFEKLCQFGDCKIWLWVRLSGVRGEKGDLKYFMVMLEDISKRKEIEDALRDSENMYRKLIQSADDRIGLFDTKGNTIILNSAYTKAIGFTEEEFMKLEDKERSHPDDKKRIYTQKKKFMDVGFTSIEYRIRHKDGHYLYMSAKIMLLKGEGVGKDYILNIIRDVSAQKEFQKELVASKEKAEESDMLKSAFLANMSHEIRTPMNSIVGFSNLLTDPDLNQDSRDEYVKRINKNSEQLLALISDIIDLSKIESNQLTISFSAIDLPGLFNDVMNYGKYQIDVKKKKKDVLLEYDPDPKHLELTIEGDLIRLIQVLQNLLNNAIKFTPKGKVIVGYRLLEGDIVRFFVKDTGVGIDPQNFDIIFDQFRQVDGSHTRKYGGTGLGLAICKNLVQMLGGRIWVESEKDEGASFVMELPMKVKHELDKVSVVVSPKKTGKKKEITILAVDDDDDSLYLLSTLLHNDKTKIILADSGYRALQILETGNLPDMVFMDLQMPVLNGKQTLNIIKDLYPELKVIVQSAHAIDGDRAKFIDMGFDDYFSKPFHKQEIMEVIGRNIGK